MAAWLATIARDLKRGGYSAFRHFDTVIKLSQQCEQNRPCFSRMTDAELEAAVDALGGEGARKYPIGCPEKETGPGTLALPSPVENRHWKLLVQAVRAVAIPRRRRRCSIRPSAPVRNAATLPKLAGSISGTEDVTAI